jgi:CRP-like cAMP-binding protein
MMLSAMHNPLVRKLSSFTNLDAETRAALNALSRSASPRKSGQILVEQGSHGHEAFLFVEGWGCRYSYTAEGKRQIMAFLLPGDLCDPYGFLLGKTDHSIGMLSNGMVAAVPGAVIAELAERSPAITRALWRSALVDQAISHQWMTSLGQRDARRRLAHLFCELWHRLHQVGLAADGPVDLPVTQEQLSNALGITAVHVNRTLQQLREEGLVEVQGRKMTIPDRSRLERAAGFDPQYLHLARRTRAG